jgi:hypothetical protein
MVGEAPVDEVAPKEERSQEVPAVEPEPAVETAIDAGILETKGPTADEGPVSESPEVPTDAASETFESEAIDAPVLEVPLAAVLSEPESPHAESPPVEEPHEVSAVETREISVEEPPSEVLQEIEAPLTEEATSAGKVATILDVAEHEVIPSTSEISCGGDASIPGEEKVPEQADGFPESPVPTAEYAVFNLLTHPSHCGSAAGA